MIHQLWNVNSLPSSCQRSFKRFMDRQILLWRFLMPWFYRRSYHTAQTTDCNRFGEDDSLLAGEAFVEKALNLLFELVSGKAVAIDFVIHEVERPHHDQMRFPNRLRAVPWVQQFREHFWCQPLQHILHTCVCFLLRFLRVLSLVHTDEWVVAP